MSYLDTTNISNYNKLNFKKVRCKKCGAEATAYLDEVLTSDPPMYNVDCPKCGRVYMFCDEVNYG